MIKQMIINNIKMTEDRTIFGLFETEEIQNRLPTENNHFTKPDVKESPGEHNKNLFESFSSLSINYFKDSRYGSEDYFFDETDNEGSSNKSSRKDFSYIINTNSTYKDSDFKIISKLGSGSYGQVFKAKHIQTNKIYALKILNKPKLKKENKSYQIYVENEMLKLCSHENIVKYIGFYENNSNFAIIEEYCPYGDLSSFLIENKRNLTVPEIQYIIGQIIICLEYLSTKNIVHRDIKPENFLITDNFTLKLIDFGTATFLGKIFDVETNQFIDDNCLNNERPCDSFVINKENNLQEEKDKVNPVYLPNQSFQIQSRDLFKYLAYPFMDVENERIENKNKHEKIKQQKFAGTAEYMAPEIINSKKIGYYTEMWSLVCILYFCFTGHNPFSDKTEYLTFQNISKVKINKNFYELITEEALDLIKNFFKKDPSERIGYKGLKHFDFNKIKSHPFFRIKDDSISIAQIRASLMSKCSYYNKRNNINTVNLNFNSSISKFEECKNEPNENIIKTGLLKKQSPYYYYDKRKIVLYDTPRIDYIDPEKKILKGRIKLTKKCSAELIKSNQFKLYTPERTFVFMCKERYNISPWVSAINFAIEKYG